ncbi:MAG: hypothetical protein ACFFEE_10385 [Candidatus Thorarchaeota archaeon]
MKLREVKREPHNRMRDVSDLRTQFQCEYRFFLKKKLSESPSAASVGGTILHSFISEESAFQKDVVAKPLFPLLIIVLTIIIGLLWIMW